MIMYDAYGVQLVHLFHKMLSLLPEYHIHRGGTLVAKLKKNFLYLKKVIILIVLKQVKNFIFQVIYLDMNLQLKKVINLLQLFQKNYGLIKIDLEFKLKEDMILF